MTRAQDSAQSTLQVPSKRSLMETNTGGSSRAVLISVDLACLLCGREMGILETSKWPEFGAVVWRRPRLPDVILLDWRRLRCANCGGAAMPSDISSRRLRSEKPIDWSEDKPRRGRPPKAVVEARRAHARENVNKSQ